MIVFKKKNIVTVKSLGEDLGKARRRLNLSLKAVDKRIGIAERYLKALEDNDWEVLPGEVYAKNWLKKYADFLGLDWIEVKFKFKEEMAKVNIWSYTDKDKFGVAKKRLIVLPKLIRNFFWALGVVVIVGYLSWQVWSLLSPPELRVVYPEDNYIGKSKFIKIVGKVEKGAWIGLNDKEVAADEYGWFSVDIDLNKGLNVIKIEAKKSYGRTMTEYRNIIVE